MLVTIIEFYGSKKEEHKKLQTMPHLDLDTTMQMTL